MGEVVPDQSWGLGEAGYPPGVRLAFKGGWGPEPGGGYLVRQIGVAGEPDHGLVVSILALAPGLGSSAFATGRQMVTAAARWVQRRLGTGLAKSASGPCPDRS
jgi:hypothetical protein